MLRNRCLVSQYFANRRAIQKTLVPLGEVRIFALELLVALRSKQEWDHGVPRDPRKVGIRSLVADEVAGTLFLQMAVDDLDDTPNFVLVTLDG